MILPATLFDNCNCNGDPLVQSKQNQQQNSQDYTKNNGYKIRNRDYTIHKELLIIQHTTPKIHSYVLT